jgi:NADPH-ferrihemoprotein reductase
MTTTTFNSGKTSILETLENMSNPNKLILFYGSQTGTAEDLASRLAKEAAVHFGIATVVADVDEYEMEELLTFPEPDVLSSEGKVLVGFFMATYGEGEPTDSATEFYDW